MSANNSYDSSSSMSDVDETPAKKKRPSSAKKPKESSAVKTGGSSTNIKRTTNSDGQKMMDLTGKKFVCVRSFRGRVFVDIREYYEDKVSGELKPGKKGISLNPEQWDNLKDAMKELDHDVVSAHS